MAAIARVLAPRGFFACNSSFFTGAYAPGSERFYHLWTRRALGWLRVNHPEARTSRESKAMAMQWLSAEEYEHLLTSNGLHVVSENNETALMPLRSWQDIGRYWLFIEGALPGIPIPIGADALEYAAAEAFTELGITEVPRIWLATRRPTSSLRGVGAPARSQCARLIRSKAIGAVRTSSVTFRRSRWLLGDPRAGAATRTLQQSP